MKKFYILSLLFVTLSNIIYAQTDKTFWFAVPEVSWRHNNGGGEPTFIRVSALDIDADVTLSMPAELGFTPMNILIPAGETRTLDITPYIRIGYVAGGAVGTENDNNIVESGLPGHEGIVENRGFLISSDNLITAYLERNNRNNPDIWALKGGNGMGDDFLVPSQDFFNNQTFTTPEALNSFDIVASEDATTVWITPTNDLKGPGGWTAGGTYSVVLNKGQSISCVATDEAASAHLGGSVVTSNRPISIIWKDDSAHSDLSGCYDLMGDQLIPNRLAGLEYIVMRGQLGQDASGANWRPNREFAYIMAIEAGTNVTFTDINGTHSTVIANVGDMHRELVNGDQIAGETSPTIDYLHIEADKPVIVFHVTGFGCEMGAAILPTIDGCTGSVDVSFMRSTTENFFLTIMTKSIRLNGFFIEIRDAANNPTSYPIPASWFTAVGTTGWYYLDKAHNEFGVAQGGIPAVPQGRVSRVYNTVGVFHLGLINGGGSSGCRYGYFSDFSESRGSAVVSETDSDLASACYGDSIQLKVEGGLTYDWNPKMFITDPNISNPIIFPPSGVHEYSVNMTRSCWPDTLMKVVVVIDPEVRAYYELGFSNLTNCAPMDLSFNNLSIGGVTYYWDFGDGTNSTVENPPDKTYTNTSGVTETYVISLTVGGNNCYDYFERTITVYPNVTGEIIPPDPLVEGCHPFSNTFGSNLNGNVDILYWDFGDGDIVYSDPNPTHVFNNLTYTDTTYLVQLVSTDTTYGYCEDRDTIMVTVFDFVDADFTANKKQDCSPLSIYIKNTSKGNVTYQWNFGLNATITGDELTDTDFNVSYTNTNASNMNRSIQLVAANNDGCADTAIILDFITYPEFTTTINTSDPLSGCNPVVIDFSQNTIPAVPNLQYAWSFGDGTTSSEANPSAKAFSHTQSTDQFYQTSLITTSEYNCKDTASPVDITVYAYVDAKFTVTPDTVGCSPFSVNISNSSYVNTAGNFTWSIGAATGVPDNNNPFTLDYVNTTGDTVIHPITLKDTNNYGCSVVYEKEITVFPEITAQFSQSNGTDTICNNEIVNFTNTSIYTSEGSPISVATPSANFYWEFGDGTTSSLENPAKSFKNTDNSVKKFPIKLTLSVNGCNSIYGDTVTVFSNILAQMNTSDVLICAPDNIQINNTSIGSSDFLWQFSDGSANQSTSDLSSINFDVNNPNLNDTIHTLIYLTANNSNCSDSDTLTLQVYPKLIPHIEPDIVSGCAPLTVQYANQTTGGNATNNILTYNWTFGDNLTSNSSDAVVPHTFNNTSANDTTFTITITATNTAGCTALHDTVVTVFPELDARFSISRSTFCSPHPVTLVNSSLNGNKFLWDFGPTGDSITNNTNSFDYTFIANKPSDTSQYAVQLIVIDTLPGHGACRDTLTNTLIMYPEVIANFTVDTASNEGCSPLVTPLLNSSLGYNLTQTWKYGDSFESGNDNNRHYHVYNNLTSTSVTYTIDLEVTDINGCKASSSQTATAYPLIIPDFTFSIDEPCDYPREVKFENGTGNGGNAFYWNFGINGNQTITDRDPFVWDFLHIGNPDSIATYSITMKAEDTNFPQCADSVTKLINIYPEVVASFTVSNNDEGCSPLNSEFTNNSNGYGLKYVWVYGDGNTSANDNTIHTKAVRNLTNATKQYNVILTAIDDNNCSSVATQPITVYQEVIADFTFLKQGDCTPYPVEFSYPDAALNGSRFEWDFGDGNDTVGFNRVTFSHVFDNLIPNSIETYSIKLYSIDELTGCDSTTIKTIDVYPRLIPVFEPDTNQGCNPLTISFSNQTTGLADYDWQFNDGQSSSESDPDHIFSHLENNNVEYNIVLNATQKVTGCSKSIDTIVTTYSYLNPKFGLRQAYNSKSSSKASYMLGGCTPFDVSVTDSSTCNGTWYWDFGYGDGNIIEDNTNPVVRELTYTNSDNTEPLENENYTINLVVENIQGCTKSTSQSLEVYPRSIPEFDVDLEGCHPMFVDFSNSTIDDGNSQYYWLLGDGATAIEKELSHTYYNNSYFDNKTFDVWLICTTSNLCSDSIEQQITVYPKPLAAINPELDRGCSPLTASLVNASKGSKPNFYWDFDNGETKETNVITHEYPEYINNTDEVDIKSVELIVESEYNCRDTVVQLVNVYPEASAEFTYYDPSDTAGCTPHEVEFLNLSNSTSTVYYWDFGNETTSQLKNPTYRFINDGETDKVFKVTLNVESPYGCQSTFQDEITVYLSPNAEFLVDEPIVTYPKTVMTFNNLVKPGPFSFSWEYGDGNSSTTSDLIHEHDYIDWGPREDNFTYKVRFSAFSEHCSDFSEQFVLIRPPKPYIEILQNNPSGCVPFNMQFEVSHGFGYEDSISWYFGDGGTAKEVNPNYTFEEPGVFLTVATIIGDGGIFIDTTKVSVYPLPEPQFEFRPTLVMLPDQPVQLFNLTFLKDEHTYFWDFGDGTYSTETDPYHQYTYEGLFEIKLVATSEYGCKDSIFGNPPVTVSGEGYVIFPNAFLPSSTSPSDGSYPSPDTENDVFHPVHSGVKNYELWIFNRWGEQIFYSDNILVGWNGRYGNNGAELGQDVFFWKTKGKFQNDEPFKKAGDVTLIRR